MYLTPEWLALEEKWGSRPTISGTIEELRAGYEGLSNMLASQEQHPPDPSVLVRDEVIYGGLRLRIYTPKEVHELGDKVPIGVYAHGGGFTVGGLDTLFEDRKVPFYKCLPTAVADRMRSKDSVATLHRTPHACLSRWDIDAHQSSSCPLSCTIMSVVITGFVASSAAPVPHSTLTRHVPQAWNNAGSLGGSQESMFAIGASCGGGLAIGAALKYLEHGVMAERVKGIVALAPMTIHPEHVPDEYRSHLKSWEENRDGPIVDYAGMMVFQSINGSTAQKRNPDAFPALHDRLAELPPTYIATCRADVIHNDGTIISVTLSKANVRCKHDKYEGLPHFFWIYPEIKEREDFHKNAAAAVQWVLGQKN